MVDRLILNSIVLCLIKLRITNNYGKIRYWTLYKGGLKDPKAFHLAPHILHAVWLGYLRVFETFTCNLKTYDSQLQFKKSRLSIDYLRYFWRNWRTWLHEMFFPKKLKNLINWENFEFFWKTLLHELPLKKLKILVTWDTFKENKVLAYRRYNLKKLDT